MFHRNDLLCVAAFYCEGEAVLQCIRAIRTIASQCKKTNLHRFRCGGIAAHNALHRGTAGFFGGMALAHQLHHGVAANDAEAGLLAVKAGVDMDMQGEVYFKYLKKQVEDGLVDEKLVDDAVRRVLRVKFMLGLFDDP